MLAKAYGAQADLRRELADSKAAVAERTEILKIFAECGDPQRAWLLLEDYFEKLSLSRKDFASQDWWNKVVAAQGKKRLEETAILFLRSNRPLPTELQPHANLRRFAEIEQQRKGAAPGPAARTLAFSLHARPIWTRRAPACAWFASQSRSARIPPCTGFGRLSRVCAIAPAKRPRPWRKLLI